MLLSVLGGEWLEYWFVGQKQRLGNASVQKCFTSSALSSDANADQREESSRDLPAFFFV